MTRLTLLAMCALLSTACGADQRGSVVESSAQASVVACKAQDRMSWPTVRGYHTLASQGNGLFLAGGLLAGGVVPAGWNGLARYDTETRRWTQVTDTIAGGDELGFDSRRNVFVAHPSYDSPDPNNWLNGIVVTGDTYAFDLRTGHLRKLDPRPPGPFGSLGGGAHMAYDRRADKIVKFGGLDMPLFLRWLAGEVDDSSLAAMLLSDTWVYDVRGNAWTKASPPVSPPARNSHMLVYDEQADRVILFGGGDFFQNYDDTWAYDVRSDTWTELRPASHPSARAYGSLTYDERRGVSVLFGGVDYFESLLDQDLWTYDYSRNTWRSTPTPGGPSARGWHDMAYSRAEDAYYLYGGGSDRDSFTDELWVYRPHGKAWRQVQKPQQPWP